MFAATSLTQQFVEEMAAIKPLGAHDLIPGLLHELPQYMAVAATCTGFNHDDLEEFSTALLLWWKLNQSKFPTWAHAARIAFAMLPNSAPSERVFSLVENMFGRDQISSLGDQLQGSAMLRYNKRPIG